MPSSVLDWLTLRTMISMICLAGLEAVVLVLDLVEHAQGVVKHDNMEVRLLLEAAAPRSRAADESR